MGVPFDNFLIQFFYNFEADRPTLHSMTKLLLILKRSRFLPMQLVCFSTQRHRSAENPEIRRVRKGKAADTSCEYQEAHEGHKAVLRALRITQRPDGRNEE